MKKTHKTEAQSLEALGRLQLVNDPSKRGELAAPKVLFAGSRYAVAPIHSRFDAIEWFVWDAEQVDEVTDGPAVIRQAPSLSQALVGLR